MIRRGPAAKHVLVVGAGGIGCPAALALAREDVGRVTIADPDEVEPSNLPRQVLFEPGDVGRPKAIVAAERLAGRPSDVRGVAARLDDRTEADLLRGVDVVVDATDGAQAKDWINATCVRRRVPLVHAAGLRSEARLLDVPAGGRPCLACLFGRLRRDAGTCADLGVWPGVVGAIGFLAAAEALRLLRGPAAPANGYLVLDLENARAARLRVEADPACPVCAGPIAPEPYLDASCADATDAGTPSRAGLLDLVDEECPMNLLRARRAVEDLPDGGTIRILLGEEGARTVPDGLRSLGHEILASDRSGSTLLLEVRSRTRRAGALDEAALRRFARQVVLPEVGEPGQARWLASTVWLRGDGPAFETAALYLATAGVGTLALSGPCDLDGLRRRAAGRVVPLRRGEDFAGTADLVRDVPEDGTPPPSWGAIPPGVPVAMAKGSLVADEVLRRLLGQPGIRA